MTQTLASPGRRFGPRAGRPAATARLARAALAAAGVALVAAGCGRSAASETAAAAPPPPSVGVAQPVVQEIVEQDDYTGRLGAAESVDVRARVDGYVDSIHFVDGQLVKKGDLLYVIDPRPYRAALDVALGEVQQAQSNLDLAQNDFERIKKLIDSQAISREDFETREKRSEAAAAALQTAKARAERAKLDLEFTEVRAPMSGRIARHMVSVGNLVAGGTADSTVLTNIVSVDPIYAYFDIDEQSYLRYLRLAGEAKASTVFKEASEVRMALMGETGFKHAGALNFIDNRIDAASGTLRARAVFQNADLNLAPGVFVKVRLAGAAPRRAILLPDRAFQADQSDRFVYVVGADNVVAQRRVTPGRLIDGMRVVTSGLDGTESVIVDGTQRARAGAPVTPEPTTLARIPTPADAATQPAAEATASAIGGAR